MITISIEDPGSADAHVLMEELSATLARITGDSGKASFDPNDVRATKARFVVARNIETQAVGCGAFRPLDENIAEVKRMYSRPGTSGVGSAILGFLETEAVNLGYQALWLETRLVNERVVSFYERRGYRRIGIRGRTFSGPRQTAPAVSFESPPAKRRYARETRHTRSARGA
jgi:GNAT superfamily N-acetyltransferase